MRGWNLLSGPVNMLSQVKGIYMLTHKVTAEKIVCTAEAVQVELDGTFQFSTYYGCMAWMFSHT